MDHYQFYAVLSSAAVASAVPAHWGLPVDINYATYDPGNRDIIFGGWNLDLDGNPTTWRRPTWAEVLTGVPGVHGPQMGPVGTFRYTYGDATTEDWTNAKFIHPHLPAGLPLVAGGRGLFSLIDNVQLPNLSLMIESVIQSCIDGRTSFYTDARKFREWLNAEELAGNLEHV